MKKVVGAKRVENKGSGDEREKERVCVFVFVGREVESCRSSWAVLSPVISFPCAQDEI